MKPKTWHKHHKWLGLLLGPFVILFCISGIVLNHRRQWASTDISRAWLPTEYSYDNYNNGLVRGTIGMPDSSTLIYGNAGIFRIIGGDAVDFNAGLPEGVDFRNIRRVVISADSALYAAARFGLYRLDSKGCWQPEPITVTEQITDLAVNGDSLLLLTRSEAYLSIGGSAWEKAQLPDPAVRPQRSLFRSIFHIHSGEALGLPGKILVDILGMVLIALCITGYIIPLRRRARTAVRVSSAWHRRLGLWSVFVLMFLVVTGMMLRPPLLIAIAQLKIDQPAHNTWHDALRAVRFDTARGHWLVSTSDGFYTLSSDLSGMERTAEQPPVSVMGINAFERDNATGDWIIGSFSGLYRWNRDTGAVTDYYTGEPAPDRVGAPFGLAPVAGWFRGPVQYYTGAESPDVPPMPATVVHGPMSLYQLALEIHTGRIFTLLGAATAFYIFFAGALTLHILLSGHRLLPRRPKKK